jgi:hypothetical protein
VSAATLLSRLEGVRRNGADRWIARCPAHDDRRPSLSVRELDDGRILLHCFADCSVKDVLAAVGLEMDGLFPPRASADRLPRERRPFDALSVLCCLSSEAAIVTTAADNLAGGLALSDGDRDRLRIAAARMRAAEELCHG